MRPQRCVGPAMLFVAIGLGWMPAFGGDSAAEAALKAKGLTKAGRVYVHEEAERPVLAKMKEVRPVYAAYASVAEKQATAEQLQMQSAMLEEQRAELRANLSVLNQQIASTSHGRSSKMARAMGPSPLQMQQQQVTAAMNEAAASQKSIKSQTPSAKDKTALDAEVKKRGETFKSALAGLRPMVDEVMDKYADLGADEVIKKSLADLEKAAKTKISLGPSEAFATVAKELDQAERRFLVKKPTAPAKKAQAKTKAKK